MFTRNKLIERITGLFVLLLNLSASYGQSSAHLVPKKGLQVITNGLSWLTGSEISFFTPDKKQHHYYFTWWEQDADTSVPGKEKLFLGSANTAVNGIYQLQNDENKIRTYFDCQWNLKSPGVADIIYARIWLPYLSGAVLSSADKNTINDWKNFTGNRLLLTAPFGTFIFYSTHPFKVKIAADLQPGSHDYSRRDQFLIIYEDNIPVNKETGLSRSFFIEETLPGVSAGLHSGFKTVVPEKIPVAWQPREQTNILLPKPKSVDYLPGRYILPENITIKETSTVTAFRNLLKLEWQTATKYFPVITTSPDLSLPEEGYTIKVNEKGIHIRYHSNAGLRFALYTLVQLVRNENGRLILPAVSISDWPSVNWRGIHMFTGPASWTLHKKMYDRILFPLKMNKVVLQCEQARWKSRPELHNSISVPMEDLKKEFDYLRSNHNEPIPLIQSLGHMEWFFKPKENRWMAINPDYPYTMNPTLPQARKAVKQLWDETFELLHPQTMHIGFDEIGMIGFNQPRENELAYFKTQISFLHQYAKSKKAKLMLWGDMGLGPGEGPDALNGVSKERAAIIRSYIPKGAYVADWHYLNNPDPEVYKTNLRIWHNNGNIPLASPWLWPDNVRGFVQAAIDEKAGVLQTTWADFESSEKNMLLNIEQFGAYILALDYSWSGRKELPAELPYNATEEWIKRFYSQPKPITAKSGYKIPFDVQLKDISSTSGLSLPDTVSLLTGNLVSSGFCLRGSTAHILPEGTTVAEIHFLKGNEMMYKKEFRYGVDIRAGADQRMIYACNGENKKQLVDFFDRLIGFDRIVVIKNHPASGLKLDELIVIGQ